MKHLIKLRFRIAWGAYRKGAIIEPLSAMHRNQLLGIVWYGQRVVEVVEEPEPVTVPVWAAPAVQSLAGPPEPPATAVDLSQFVEPDSLPRQGKRKRI